jgi:hypothetical protein
MLSSSAIQPRIQGIRCLALQAKECNFESGYLPYAPLRCLLQPASWQAVLRAGLRITDTNRGEIDHGVVLQQDERENLAH